MKKFTVLLLVLCGLMSGCAVTEDVTDYVGENNSYENSSYENNSYYISHTTECLREEQKELYEAMQVLLTKRDELEYMLVSPDIDLNNENIFKSEEGLTYYPLKDSSLTKEDIRKNMSEIYATEYVDGVLMPFYFEKLKCYIENEGQLYGLEADGVVLSLKENWTIWKVNEDYYYLQGHVDTDEDIIVILTIIRSKDGEGFLISDEVEINL